MTGLGAGLAWLCLLYGTTRRSLPALRLYLVLVATALAAYWLWLTYLSAGLGENEASKEVSSMASYRLEFSTAFPHPNLRADVRLPAGGDGLAASALPPHPAAVQTPGGDGPSPPRTHRETPPTLPWPTTTLLIYLNNKKILH